MWFPEDLENTPFKTKISNSLEVMEQNAVLVFRLLAV